MEGERGMKDSRIRLFSVFILVLLAGVVLIGVFWNTILLAIAPKVVLSSALSDALSQLQTRFQKSPWVLVAQSYDVGGNYSVDAEFSQMEQSLGEVRYDLEIQTDGSENCIMAEGTITALEQELRLSGFANQDFMAIASDELTNKDYYGITYDTFSADVRKIPFLGMLITEQTLLEWNKEVQKVKSQMSKMELLPKIPDISGEDVSKLLLGVAAMPCQRERRALDSGMTCQVFTYTIPEAQGNRIISTVIDTPEMEKCEITVSLYLWESTVVQISAKIKTNDETMQGSLYLGTDPLRNPLCFQYGTSTGGNGRIEVSTEQEENQFAETWVIQNHVDGQSHDRSITYRWDFSTGDMELSDGQGRNIVGNLRKTEQGFAVKTEDFGAAYTLLTEKAWEGKRILSCSANVRKGSSVITPGYRNIDQWSMEDLLTLVQGVGALFGLRISG